MSIKLAVFASGNGSNFEAIVKEKYKNIEITMLICDNDDAYCIERSKKFQIPYHIFIFEKYKNKLEYELAILETLKANNIDLIVLAGYMRIIGDTILDNYHKRIINIHPSLLPAFKGRIGVKDAYDYGVKIMGITIHYVSKSLDSGEIIAQDCFFVGNKTLEEAEAEIHKLEHKLYPQILRDIDKKAKMKVLIIGSGGREHAIAAKISASYLKPTVFVSRGNPGMDFATLVDIDESDNQALVDFALKENIDLTIVGPESALNNGIVNEFKKNNLLIFGPTKEAAIIESSKKYAKDLMVKYQIPTASYHTVDNYDDAIKYVSENKFPTVLKYDGLALGKGVVIANNINEAASYFKEVFIDNKYGNAPIVIEEYLEGPEFTLMAFVNGEKVYPMQIAQDHKRAYDEDLGPNTGGMGAYSPVPIINDDEIKYVETKILKPIAQALVQEGRSFLGVLYGGLMKTKDGIKVIEFNARFGDPETEVVLPRLKNDLLEVFLDVIDKKNIKLEWDPSVVLGVVMASNGYPNEYQKEEEIYDIPNDDVYHMGTKILNSKIVNNGGRVLMVIGRGKTFKEARENAYNKVSKIKSANLFYRRDIGFQMLKHEDEFK